MTALVSATIRSHIEDLADQAEFWQARASYWSALGQHADAKRCADYADDVEHKAMTWAAKLECLE